MRYVVALTHQAVAAGTVADTGKINKIDPNAKTANGRRFVVSTAMSIDEIETELGIDYHVEPIIDHQPL